LRRQIICSIFAALEVADSPSRSQSKLRFDSFLAAGYNYWEMASIFSFFKQNVFPTYLGVDIGTTSIKIVEVKPGKQLPAVINYGLLESSSYLSRANQVLQTSTLKIFENEAAELLKLVVKEMKTKTTEALASLPIFSAFTTILDFPEMQPSELAKAIPFQAKQYIPLPLSEVAVDWMKVGEFEDDKGYKHQRILLISVPQETIKKYQRIFKQAGLHLKALEIESLSLARIFGGTDPTPTVVVDIGSRSTSIAFIADGQLKFSKQSDFAGASFTQALAVSLGINPIRAEELKKERGISGTGPNYELSTIMLPFLDAIINEVKKARYDYEEQFKEARKIERVLLSGGGANMLGIEKYFEREMSLPVVKAAPFVKFEYPAVISPLIPELSPLMSVVLGLTLREFI
jgi:type IV pilus assembly protein PilM